MKITAFLRPLARLLLAPCLLGVALCAATLFPSRSSAQADAVKKAPRPIHILFLGHEGEHHNSNAYYPMLAKALGPDAIYFDYTTNVAEALEPEFLNRFDGLMLYANHTEITEAQLKALIDFVESGHGFIPVHCASACFTAHPEFIKLVGGQFKSHTTGVFQAKIVKPEHPALAGVKEFSCWDETYVHSDHNEENRTVRMSAAAIRSRSPSRGRGCAPRARAASSTPRPAMTSAAGVFPNSSNCSRPASSGRSAIR
jgi:type 1 glutamine amidotransferase